MKDSWINEPLAQNIRRMKSRITTKLAIVVVVAGHMVLLPMFATDLAASAINWDESATVLEWVEKCTAESNSQRDRLDYLNTHSQALLLRAPERVPIAALEVARHFCSQVSCPPKNKSPPNSA